MNHRPVASIALILLSFAVTFIAPTFDSSFYGLDGHPSGWLSFSPQDPLRHMGLSLILSPFLHVNLIHLMTNVIVFIPVAMMMERKKSGSYLTFQFFLIHFLVLILLVLSNLLFPMGNKAFLGSSHIITGLYTFWALANKKYGLLVLPLFIISIGLWENQSLTLLSHSLGFFAGVIFLILGRLHEKLRS